MSGLGVPHALALPLLVAVLAGACSSDSGTPAADGGASGLSSDVGSGAEASPLVDATPTSGFYPCDVEAVLKAKCHTCHTMPPRNGAPMSLLAWEATQKLVGGSATTKVWQRAREYVSTGYMPFQGSPTGPLTASEKSTLLTWLEGGAQPAPQACQ